jgi:hypothetical protein
MTEVIGVGCQGKKCAQKSTSQEQMNVQNKRNQGIGRSNQNGSTEKAGKPERVQKIAHHLHDGCQQIFRFTRDSHN